MILVHCHAGCSQDEVIAALDARGLWKRTFSEPVHTVGHTQRSNAKLNTERALSIWQMGLPAEGSLVATYLSCRGIITDTIPSALRFCPGLRYEQFAVWPVMVAAVTDVNGQQVAIHRTFIARDGTGKAPVQQPKKMLGPCMRNSVHLAPPQSGKLMVGEGIETCLSAMIMFGLPAWAALSCGGLRAIDLPPDVCDVTILADADDAGEDAAQSCFQRLRREGRKVDIQRPLHGRDFNDMLMNRS